MNPSASNPICKEIAPLLVFYACDEVTDQERTAIERHLAACSECSAELTDELEFKKTLNSLPDMQQELDPSGILLGQCRSQLSETIDDMEYPPLKEVGRFAWLRRWMSLHPAWSAATLVLFGLVAGTQTTQWFTGRNNANALDSAVNVRPGGPHLTEDQLSKMAVAGINFSPSADNSGAKTVRVQLSAEQPVELSGSLDDSDVRRVLTYVLKNGQKFDPGVRLDCLDALRTRAEDSQVRDALLAAARKDQNPAVRLKALEALRETVADAEVRETLLEALQHDGNPGVRVEAVNLLVYSIGAGSGGTVILPEATDMADLPQSYTVQSGTGMTNDDSAQNVIRALEHLQHSDPSRYVRLRSAAALREISVRNEQ